MILSSYPKYKDSGLKWLGPIPEHWHVRRLKHACKIVQSNVDKHSRETELPIKLCNYKDVYYNEKITSNLKFMQSTASLEQVKKFTLRAGDTIITKDSEMANDIAVSAYVPEDLPGIICGYHLAMIRPYSGTNGAFLKRLFDSAYAKTQLAIVATGLTRVGLGQYALSNIEFAFPPEGEQAAIADFLEHELLKIDTLIAEKEELLKVLAEKRQAIIYHAITSGIHSNVPMKESGVSWLGKIPAHWQVLPIKRLSSVKRGASPRPIDDPRYFDENGDYAWVRISDVSASNGILLNTSQRLSKIAADVSVKLKPGNLFISIAGTVGKPCITAINACIHDGFVYFPNLNIPAYFIFRIFEVGLCYSGLGKFGTQLNLNTDTIGSIKIALPPIDEIQPILDFIDQEINKIDGLKSNIISAINLLKERRSTLIYAAVSGKINVLKSTINEA